MTSVRAIAPAKLNLALDVFDRRPDGFHRLSSVMTTVDLADYVTVEEAPQVSVRVIDHTGSGEDLSGRGNTAFRAAQAMEWRFWTKPVAVTIEKWIPVAAGLGGGSSDAAATIRAIDSLFDIGLNFDEQARLGQDVGSDVPFFAYGGTCLVGGRGEVVQPLTDGRFAALVVAPDITVGKKTATLFGLLDKRGAAGGQTAERLAASWPEWSGAALHNDFEAVAGEAFPGIETVRQALRDAGAEPRLSGAGPAVYGAFRERAEAERARQALPSGLRAFVVSALPAKAARALETR